MIKCGKCGKLYDYNKYEGICPKCARYNRPDSRAEMEQDLHDRYDSNPNMHAAQRERSFESRNFESRSSVRGNSGNRNRWAKVIAILAVIICAVSVIGTVAIEFFQKQIISLVDELEGWGDNTFDNIDDAWQEDDTWYADDEMAVNRREEIYVNYAWSDYLGTELADVDWDSVYVEISEEEKQELAGLLPEDTEYMYGSCVLDDRECDFECYIY